jgi:photosystem II stability/assembly factor-like uncharacterized protein
MAYCDGALVKTTDGGQTWKTVSRLDIREVIAMAISSGNPGIIFIGGDESLYVSTDGGGTWQECSNGLPAGRFEIKINPHDVQQYMRMRGMAGIGTSARSIVQATAAGIGNCPPRLATAYCSMLME